MLDRTQDAIHIQKMLGALDTLHLTHQRMMDDMRNVSVNTVPPPAAETQADAFSKELDAILADVPEPIAERRPFKPLPLEELTTRFSLEAELELIRPKTFEHTNFSYQFDPPTKKLTKTAKSEPPPANVTQGFTVLPESPLPASPVPNKSGQNKPGPIGLEISRADLKSPTSKPKSLTLSRVSTFFFYFVLVAAVALAFFVNRTNGNQPKTLMGYSIFTVLTRSMQSEIPQDSFVLTQKAAPDTLQIGDDITYLRPGDKSVTHRIVAIYDNYNNSGARGFETKGIENPKPDLEVVYAKNVVGKVVFHSLWIGQNLKFAAAHWQWLAAFVLMAMITLLFLKRTFKKEKGGEPKESRKKSETPLCKKISA
jgi:signal peptidase